jgi:hypothetical protein
MGSGLDSLHKILKDETRRKIVLLLNEKGALSHTDLMEELGFLTTGLLNYHLKQLDGLLTKDADGKYILAEKGKLAIRLLTEFPEQNRKQMGMKPKWWRKFWIGIGAAAVLTTVTNLLAYFLGYVSITMFLQNFLIFLALIGALYMTEHITMEVLSEKNRSRLLRINNFARGVVVGFLLWFALTFATEAENIASEVDGKILALAKEINRRGGFAPFPLQKLVRMQLGSILIIADILANGT